MNFKNVKIFKILSQTYLVKAFSFFSLSQAISAITAFGILVLYTKFLPPTDFGKIALIWIFVIIASTIIDGRLNTAFSIRFYRVSKEENIKNIYSIFIYNLVIFCLIYLVFLLFPLLFQKISRVRIEISNLNIIFLLILCMVFGKFYTNILIVAQKPKNYFWVNLLFNTILIVSNLVYLVVLKAGYIAYFKAYLISYLTVALMGLGFFIINYKPCKNVISLGNLKELLKISLPLVPAGLSLLLLTWADRYMLNLYVGLAIVGIYTVGYRCAEVINRFIINPFGQALSPLGFKQFAKSLEGYKDILRKVIKYYWLVIFGIMIGYFVVLREIFQFLIGVKYIEGYNVVGIVLLGVILWGATNFLGGTVIVKEKTGKMFLFNFIAVFLNIGLNFILIPKYGMYGAAMATLIAYVIQFAIIFIYTQKLIFINYDYKFIVKSVFISLWFFAFVLCLSYLKVNVAVRLGLKTTLFLLFILVAYKFMGLKNAIKGFFNYGIISKKTVS